MRYYINIPQLIAVCLFGYMVFDAAKYAKENNTTVIQELGDVIAKVRRNSVY